LFAFSLQSDEACSILSEARIGFSKVQPPLNYDEWISVCSSVGHVGNGKCLPCVSIKAKSLLWATKSS